MASEMSKQSPYGQSPKGHKLLAYIFLLLLLLWQEQRETIAISALN